MTYLALAKAGFRRWSSYRTATLAGLFTNTIFGFLRVAVLFAALDAGGAIGGYSRADAATYTWLTQGLIATIAIWGWVELANRIQTGDVVTDLQRPVDLQGAYLAEDLGRATYQLLARGVPPFLVGALVFELTLPSSVGRWIAFGVSMFLAIVISFAMRFIVNLLSFWVLDWRGFNAVSQLLTTIASGFALPLAFYPAWAESVLMALPWAAMVQLPINIFIGSGSIAGALALQSFWAVTLLGIGRVLLARATLRVVVQGG